MKIFKLFVILSIFLLSVSSVRAMENNRKYDAVSDTTKTDTMGTSQNENGRGYGRCHRGIRRTEFKDKNNDGVCDDREGCIGIRHRCRGGDENK